MRNPSEFIEESEWIHWEISRNSLRNPSEFIEEFELIVDFNWICLIQMNLLNKKNTKMIKKFSSRETTNHISACYVEKTLISLSEFFGDTLYIIFSPNRKCIISFSMDLDSNDLQDSLNDMSLCLLNSNVTILLLG